jgi:hypothetical protein
MPDGNGACCFCWVATGPPSALPVVAGIVSRVSVRPLATPSRFEASLPVRFSRLCPREAPRGVTQLKVWKQAVVSRLFSACVVYSSLRSRDARPPLICTACHKEEIQPLALHSGQCAAGRGEQNTSVMQDLHPTRRITAAAPSPRAGASGMMMGACITLCRPPWGAPGPCNA